MERGRRCGPVWLRIIQSSLWSATAGPSLVPVSRSCRLLPARPGPVPSPALMASWSGGCRRPAVRDLWRRPPDGDGVVARPHSGPSRARLLRPWREGAPLRPLSASTAWCSGIGAPSSAFERPREEESRRVVTELRSLPVGPRWVSDRRGLPLPRGASSLLG